MELLIACAVIARFHFRDQPAVKTHFAERGSDGVPVIVANEETCINRIATSTSLFHDILYVNARDARSMYLNPLFSESSVVDVPHIEMNTNERTVYLIEECPEFPRLSKKRCSELQFSQPILT